MINEFPAYAYLGSQRWIRRDRISPSLIGEYDRTLALARDRPGTIDRVTGRAFGALWLDAVDQITEQAGPLMDRAGVLEDQALHQRAHQRSLDAMFSRPLRRP
jgi:hypothetical protein